MDWSSFSLVTPPTPTSPSITLSTNVDGDHVILYVVPNPLVTESFSWTICDTGGNCADTAIYTVVECPDSVTATDDTECAFCNETSTLDILANDTSTNSPIKLNSITIVTAPTKGTVTIPGDGTVLYTPNIGQTGADQFTYTIKNAAGSVSNTATVDIDIHCAGTSTTVNICN